MRALDAAAVSYAVVLTKGDKVKPADRHARIAATLEGLRKHVAAYPEVLLTSARTSDGVADLRAHIVKLITERGSIISDNIAPDLVNCWLEIATGQTLQLRNFNKYGVTIQVVDEAEVLVLTQFVVTVGRNVLTAAPTIIVEENYSSACQSWQRPFDDVFRREINSRL